MHRVFWNRSWSVKKRKGMRCRAYVPIAYKLWNRSNLKRSGAHYWITPKNGAIGMKDLCLLIRVFLPPSLFLCSWGSKLCVTEFALLCSQCILLWVCIFVCMPNPCWDNWGTSFLPQFISSSSDNSIFQTFSRRDIDWYGLCILVKPRPVNGDVLMCSLM